MPIKAPVRQFIVTSLIFLIGGLFLGLVMLDQLARGSSTYQLVWAHVHMLLVGFMLSMIYGVGYQMLPSLLGGRLNSRRLPFLHLIFHIGGVTLMIIGVFLARSKGSEAIYYNLSSLGGMLVVIGGIFFVYSMATIKRSKSFFQIMN